MPQAAALIDAALGGRMQARRGELVDVLEGDGLIAEYPGSAGRPIGLIIWMIAPGGASAELRAVAVDAEFRGRGIARALFDAAHHVLRDAGVGTAWLVTTNDNAPALRLYASLGYLVTEVRHGAIDEIRRTVKPSIPLVGHDGIEMHDELELRRSIETP
jgi:ribosomal protein S18 acetylase RimI-like enzyme